jgi:hypothetical protein
MLTGLFQIAKDENAASEDDFLGDACHVLSGHGWDECIPVHDFYMSTLAQFFLENTHVYGTSPADVAVGGS